MNKILLENQNKELDKVKSFKESSDNVDTCIRHGWEGERNSELLRRKNQELIKRLWK